MTALDKMRRFIGSYPGADTLSEFKIDYTDQIPSNGGLFPSGLVEIERKNSILGELEITNQYNFGLYIILEKSPGDDIGAKINAEWIMKFQEWVQDQSSRGMAPVFGDVPEKETVTAQNGSLYGAEGDGLGIYMIQISVKFIKKIRRKNVWAV